MSSSDTPIADKFGESESRARSRVTNGVHMAEDAIKHGEEALKKGLEQSKMKLGEAADAAASRVEEAHAYVTRQAREKPVQTTAIAVGAGLLLGLFMAGRRRN